MGNTITGKPADEFSLWSTRLRIPTGWKQTSWLFTRVTEELYTGRSPGGGLPYETDGDARRLA